eukprot:m.922028 g.922028  ORF g.922028 m.922028 type:complete len:124 (+) comp93464_c0_seq1:70-441(+)
MFSFAYQPSFAAHQEYLAQVGTKTKRAFRHPPIETEPDSIPEHSDNFLQNEVAAGSIEPDPSLLQIDFDPSTQDAIHLPLTAQEAESAIRPPTASTTPALKSAADYGLSIDLSDMQEEMAQAT